MEGLSYQSQEEVEKKKKRRKIAIILGVLLLAAILFLLWILFGRDLFPKAVAQIYRPILTMELDMSHMGQKPIVVLSLELPEVRLPSGGPLGWNLPNQIEATVPSDGMPFAPIVKPKIVLKPVSNTDKCKNLTVVFAKAESVLQYQTVTPPGSKTKPQPFKLVLPLPGALTSDAPALEAGCLAAVVPASELEALSVREKVGVVVKRPKVLDSGFVCPIPWPDTPADKMLPEELNELLKCLPAELCGNGVIDAAEECDPPGSLTCPVPGGAGVSACTPACTCGVVPPWKEPPRKSPPREELPRPSVPTIKTESLRELPEARNVVPVEQLLIDVLYRIFGLDTKKEEVEPIGVVPRVITLQFQKPAIVRVIEKIVEKVVSKPEVVTKEVIPESVSQTLKALEQRVRGLKAPAVIAQCVITVEDPHTIDNVGTVKINATNNVVSVKIKGITATGSNLEETYLARNITGTMDIKTSVPTGAVAAYITATDQAGVCGLNKVAILHTFSVGRAAAVCSGAPTVAENALPNGTRNVAYSTTLSATGGCSPYTWEIYSGTLPNGLSLNASTGVISGTPDTSGASSIRIRVTDGNSQTDTWDTATITID